VNYHKFIADSSLCVPMEPFMYERKG
jgi:hypothetical protein